MRTGILLLLLYPSVLFAQEVKKAEASTPLPQLLDQVVGIASRPAVYRWRDSSVTMRFMTGQVNQQNNFSSFHWGFLFDFPSDSFNLQAGLRRSRVSDTESSRQLALTPYKQAAHADRYEIVSGVKTPLIEGIGSQLYDLIPQSQFVLHGVARLHFHLYPRAASKVSFQDTLQGLFQTRIGGEEYRIIQEQSPSAMLPSRSRHSLGAGFAIEQFFPGMGGQAFHVSLEIVTMFDIYTDESTPNRWMEYSLGVGYDI